MTSTLNTKVGYRTTKGNRGDGDGYTSESRTSDMIHPVERGVLCK